MADRIYNVLSLGAGWQSSRIFLGACRGELPKFDAAVFADTQWEPKAVYENLAFLKAEGEKAGIPIATVTRGNLRADMIEFRRTSRSADGKRFASIPAFIKNPDGTQGRVKRQCTKEYKIEAVDWWIRRFLLGLPARKRVPRGVLIRHWFGISEDEGRRAVFPGRFEKVKEQVGTDLHGDPVYRERQVWRPKPWVHHVYPLLNEIWLPSRKVEQVSLLPPREQRPDCGAWLAQHYPGRTFPRSACIGCPFRSNAEWREMRDHRPEEWADACEADEAMRARDEENQLQRWKGQLVGLPYLHRQLVPLHMADLDGAGEKGGGCGTLYDGMDGMCDV